MSRPPFGRNRVFSLEVSQKCANGGALSVGSVFFSRSHAAWESNFAKVALKALARGHFHFGGELVVLSRILAFFVLFSGRGRSPGVLARDRVRNMRISRFTLEVSKKLANCRTSRAKRILF